MGWMEEWYRTMAEHNTGKCDPPDCRHCKREQETRHRIAETVVKAKILFGELKDTIITTVEASYNGGYDEGFVDYVQYFDNKRYEIHSQDLYKVDEQSEPFRCWSKQMESIAWGILGYGFGTGDYSVSGTIVLNVKEGKLYNHRELIADLKEAA